MCSRQINSSTIPSVRRRHRTLCETTTEGSKTHSHRKNTPPSGARRPAQRCTDSPDRPYGIRINTRRTEYLPKLARVGVHPGQNTSRSVVRAVCRQQSARTRNCTVLRVATLRARCGLRRSSRVRLLSPLLASWMVVRVASVTVLTGNSFIF